MKNIIAMLVFYAFLNVAYAGSITVSISDVKSQAVLDAYKGVYSGQFSDWKKSNPSKNELLFIRHIIILNIKSTYQRHQILENKKSFVPDKEI